MDRNAENSGTGAVRNAHRFDTVSLHDWMASNIAGFAGPLGVEQFKGGQSNPTHRLSTADRRHAGAFR